MHTCVSHKQTPVCVCQSLKVQQGVVRFLALSARTVSFLGRNRQSEGIDQISAVQFSAGGRSTHCQTQSQRTCTCLSKIKCAIMYNATERGCSLKPFDAFTLLVYKVADSGSNWLGCGCFGLRNRLRFPIKLQRSPLMMRSQRNGKRCAARSSAFIQRH